VNELLVVAIAVVPDVVDTSFLLGTVATIAGERSFTFDESTLFCKRWSPSNWNLDLRVSSMEGSREDVGVVVVVAAATGKGIVLDFRLFDVRRLAIVLFCCFEEGFL
jgi:hypothetical protein